MPGGPSDAQEGPQSLVRFPSPTSGFQWCPQPRVQPDRLALSPPPLPRWADYAWAYLHVSFPSQQLS